jgi:hypothetical protein
MLNIYGRRLDINIASIEEDEIMVFATPIKRTQQSAAGFVAGMLEKVFKSISGVFVCVQVKVLMGNYQLEAP